MRRAKISMLILLCILTAGLCGILIYGISGRGLYSWGGSTGSYGSYGSPQLVMEKEVPLDGIDHITVQYDMNNNDIYIYEGEGDVLTIREYNELALEEKDLSTVTVSGSGVEIRGRRRNGNSFRIQVGRFGIRSAYGYTEIRLPASYKGQLSLSSASGDIRSEMDISLAEGFQAEAVSGDVVIPNITASKVSLGSSSGDIKVDAVSAGINDSAGAVDIETVSGDINVGQLAGEIDIESSSGEITVKQLTGATKIKSISGNIESESIAGDAWLGTTSGDIAVQRIDGAVTAESSSGGVKILAGAGGRNVKTTSGDIRLEGMEGSWETHSSSGGVWIKSGRIDSEEFYAWSEEAREKKAECEAGKISFEEFSAWLGNSWRKPQRETSGWLLLAAVLCLLLHKIRKAHSYNSLAWSKILCKRKSRKSRSGAMESAQAGAESLGQLGSRRARRYARRRCECRPACRDILQPGISQQHGRRTGSPAG